MKFEGFILKSTLHGIKARKKPIKNDIKQRLDCRLNDGTTKL